MGMFVYKMFKPDLVCRGYKFKVGLNECEHATCVKEGFHAAENPLDCLSYYLDFDASECWLCYAYGDIHEDGSDSKISCTKLEILRRLEKHEFIREAVNYMISHPKRERSRYIQVEQGETNDNGFAIVVGEAPRAIAKENGAVIALVREDENGKPIKFALLYGPQVRKGCTYHLKEALPYEE